MGFHLATFGHTRYTPRQHADPEPYGAPCVSSGHTRKWTQTTPRPPERCRFHLAMQTIHPDHTHTRALWSPMVSFGHTKPCTQATPRPQAPWCPMGATWPYKTYTQTTPRRRDLWSLMGFIWPHKPSTQTTPRPRTLWSSMGASLMEPYGSGGGPCACIHKYAQTTPRP